MSILIPAIIQNILIFINYVILAKPKDFRFLLKQIIFSATLIILCGTSFVYFQKYMIIFTAITFYIIGILIFKNSIIKTINTISV